MNPPFNNTFPPPTYNPNNLLNEDQEIPPKIELMNETIYKLKFEKNHPLLTDEAKKANYQLLDFNEKILEINKTQVTLNLLPTSRYGRFNESKLLLVTQTNLISQVENFLEKFYKNPLTTCWITGPSGGGKSFSILLHVLKARKSRKDIVLLHIIMSEEYFKKLPLRLFNDVFYAFYPFFMDIDFPECPYTDAQKTPYPLINWLLFLSDNLDEPTTTKASLFSIFDYFIKFFSVAMKFFKTKGILFAIVIDQINIIQRLKIEHLATKQNFFDFLGRITSDELSHKVIISSSDSNEDLDSTLMANDNEDQILKAALNGTFSREQVNLILQHHCDFRLEEAQFDKLEEITGFVPLEIWSFGINEGKDFDEKFRNYMQNRKKEIKKEIEIFYKNKTKNESKWEVTFLKKHFVLLDTESQINEESYEITIDRRYMFVKNDRLYSVSPIAREVLNFFYSEQLSELKQEHQNQFICNLRNIYRKLDSKCDASLKGYIFEKLIIHQLIAKEPTESDPKKMLLTYHYKGGKLQKDITFSKVVFFQNDLLSVISETSSVYVPFKFNYPFVDLFLYDSTDSILYAFQITLNIKSHKNSDTQFKASQEYVNLKANTYIKNIIFIWVTEATIDYVDISRQFESQKPQKKKKQKLKEKLSKPKAMVEENPKSQKLKKEKLSKPKTMGEENPKSNSRKKKSAFLNTREGNKRECKEESQAVYPIDDQRKSTRLADKIQNETLAKQIITSEKVKKKKSKIEEELKQNDSKEQNLEEGAQKKPKDNDKNEKSEVNNYKDEESYFLSVAENRNIWQL